MSWIKGFDGSPIYRGIPDENLVPPEPKVLLTCDECGEDIEEGQEFYRLGGCIYCEGCVNNARRYAGVDEDLY